MIERLKLDSPDFTEGGKIPIECTGRGWDQSPEFNIHNLSPDGKTIAIIMDDIQHHIFGTFNHWLIWNIPAQPHIPGKIPEGKLVISLAGASQGIGYGRHRYAGPKPPKGKQHAYKFTVYVLDRMIAIKNTARKEHLLKEIEPHIIQQGEITGFFE